MNTWDADHARKIDNNAVAELASRFGEAADIVSSQQRALEIVLESMDAAQFGTAVVLPVVAPEWMLTAVLRTRCQPILIDSGTASLSMNRTILKEALDDLGDWPCVVVHYSPFGDAIHEEALDIAKDTVTVLVTPNLPGPSPATAFSIFDMCPAMSKGALLATNYADQHVRVRATIARSGDYVSPYEAAIASKFFGKERIRAQAISEVAQTYTTQCKLRGLLPCLPTNQIVRHFPIMVKNAAYMQAFLRGNKIDSSVELNSLAQLPYVKAIVDKKFPNADARHNHVLSLPTNIKPQLVPFILDLVNSVEARQDR
ncbi:MAG: hypothetical protein JWO15_3623 [Sphingomonadales bacterium]|nr:hypothetical protein [Sphingomonadales bacterium]